MFTTEACQDKTDEELARLSIDDAKYFECLMQRYEGKLLRYIRRISSVTQEEAEDVLQESFIKVYTNLNDFDKDLKFSSWIYRIVHNQVISNFRKNKARPQGNTIDMDDEVLHNVVSDLDVLKDIDQEYLRKHLFQILDTLDEKYREVLVLKFLEDKDYKEISDILKKPMGTVATLINRAKKKCKVELEKSNIEL